MRRVGKIAAQTLVFLSNHINAGISTEEIDRLANSFIEKNNAKSATLNYNEFPKSICTSINNVVCHGIPAKKDILCDGDIVNTDITIILDGYHADTSRTFIVGKASPEAKLLVERTEKAMYKGIEVVKPGIYLYEVGRAIENYIKPFGYSIVSAYCGHGIGKDFHEEPHVHHFFSEQNKIKLKPGMVFTVEPMINMGRSEIETSKEDGWTVTTKDGSLSAQFEHTVAVVEGGYMVLTAL